MGALNYQDDLFLNYISQAEISERINQIRAMLKNNSPLNRNCEIYLFGSYLRKKIYNDIDVLVVYKDGISTNEVDTIIRQIKTVMPDLMNQLHFQCVSSREFSQIQMDFDNRVKVW